MTVWPYILLVVVAFISTDCSTSMSAQTARIEAKRMSKMGPELKNIYAEYSSYLASRRPGVFQPSNLGVRVIDDRVVIDAVASGDVNVLKIELIALGMQDAVAFGRVVSGQLPIEAIPAVAALPSLKFARAVSALMQLDQ